MCSISRENGFPRFPHQNSAVILLNYQHSHRKKCESYYWFSKYHAQTSSRGKTHNNVISYIVNLYI
jgi:hypothetical protein